MFVRSLTPLLDGYVSFPDFDRVRSSCDAVERVKSQDSGWGT